MEISFSYFWIFTFHFVPKLDLKRSVVSIARAAFIRSCHKEAGFGNYGVDTEMVEVQGVKLVQVKSRANSMSGRFSSSIARSVAARLD